MRWSRTLTMTLLRVSADEPQLVMRRGLRRLRMAMMVVGIPFPIFMSYCVSVRLAAGVWLELGRESVGSILRSEPEEV